MRGFTFGLLVVAVLMGSGGPVSGQGDSDRISVLERRVEEQQKAITPV